MNKTIIFILMILLILPVTVMAFDESIVKTPFTVEWHKESNNEATLIIKPGKKDTALEGGGYAKVITYNITEICEPVNNTNSTNSTNCTEIKGLNEDFLDELTLITTRRFGNYTEVQYNLEQFATGANFTKKWKECIDLNSELWTKMQTKMINKSRHDAVVKNMTSEIDSLESSLDSKEKKISELETEKENANTWKDRVIWAAIILAGVVIVFVYKYWGWFRKKQHDQVETPRDGPA